MNDGKDQGYSFYLQLTGVSIATLLFVVIVLRFFPSSEQPPAFKSGSTTPSDTIDWVKPDINSLGNSENDEQIK